MTQLEAQPGKPRPGEPPASEPPAGGLTLAAARFFATRLAGSWVPAYLAGRGFGEQALRPWTVGYAPAGWRVLTVHLRDLGYGDRHPGCRAGPANQARRARRLLQGPGHVRDPLVAGLPSGQVARQVARVARQLGLSFAEVTDAVTGALRP